MRIIGGRWRGRRLPIPRGTDVRPTPDRVRETVFNWLAASLERSTCLDLFAGTGALGLECLSRGANQAVLVERDAALANALRERVAALDANASVLERDAVTLLKEPPLAAFDVVFLDPPYSTKLEPLLAGLGPWLGERARIYVERPRGGENEDALEPLARSLAGVRPIKRGHAGAVAFALLEYRRP